MLSIRKGLALVLAATLLVLVGCSGTKTDEKKVVTPEAPKPAVKITIWHGMGADSAHGKVATQLIKEFNDSQKEVIVEEVYQGSYSDLETKLTAAIAAQTPPTIAQNNDTMLTNLVKAKAVQPLDSLVPAAEKADYPPALLAATTFDGKLYALPFNKSAVVLIYDKTLVPNPPKDWDEFHKVAKQVTVPGQIYGTAFPADIYYFGQHLAGNGNGWLTADGKAAFNSPEGVAALQFIVDMAKDGSAIQLKPKEYQSSYFNEGRAAMIATTSASFAYIIPANKHPWGVAPLYAGPKGAGVPLSGANVSIMNGIKPEETQAAAKFILWLTGKEATLKWAMGKTGYGPVRISATKDPRWTEFTKANPEYQVLADALVNGKIQVNDPNWGKVQKEITTAVESALLGKTTAKQALDEAAAKANDILGKK
ncbi:MAG TPA: ABC transporter substrate-binding protein [Symbiobacteriaceae bacterium]|jgi:ABC-type glycerol-3-phosphate transport system substrate-binding protein